MTLYGYVELERERERECSERERARRRRIFRVLSLTTMKSKLACVVCARACVCH